MPRSLQPSDVPRRARHQIDRLYAEIRELMARSATDSEHEQQNRDRFSRLRELQEEEADALETRFRARRRLRPGEGHRALERAQRIIENVARRPQRGLSILSSITR